MGFTTNSLDLIRRVFRRDQMIVGASPEVVDRMDFATRGMTAMMTQAYGPLSGGVDNYMHDTVSLNHDLIARYEDYEQMDEFPEISTCLDLFADDATVQDVLDGKSIWFEAPDDTLQNMLNTMLEKQLRVEEDLWDYTRSTCKFGNGFLEIVALDKQGVIELKPMYVPATRRIQDQEGLLYGYVHDPALGFSITTTEFFDRIKAKSMEDSTKMLPPMMDHVKVFEPWEVVHFRMRGSNVADLYGISITDAARYAWKRLMMMEDAMVVYKLCLRGDSRVWTTSGTTKIADIKEGDEVYSYAAPGRLKKTKVVYKKCNGIDKIYRVRSLHRDLYANATHPVLVETIEHNGSGCAKTRRLDYVEVKDLIPGVHRFCTPSRSDRDFKPVKLKLPKIGFKARLKPKFHGQFGTAEFSKKAQEMGISYPYLRRFLSGESELVLRAATAAVQHLGLSVEESLDLREDWGGVKNICIPAVVDEEFAQWFGFMLGDGYVADFSDKDGFKHRRVGFACGDDEVMNQKYRQLFEKYVGPSKFGGDQGYRYGYYQVSSKAFSDFMVLNGFVPGCHNKVVPAWVYQTSPSIKLAFLEGFADADGHWSTESVSKIRRRRRHARARIKLCNRELVEGLRDLAMQTGLVVTRVYEKHEKGGYIIVGTKTPIKDRISYWFDIVYKPAPRSEKIMSVTRVDGDEIWDIGVEAEEHNFIADGVVVHNTRSAQRYAFYVDVGDAPPPQAKRLLQQVKNDFKKEKVLDKDGKVSFKYSPLSADEDFFMAVRKDKRTTEVEVLSAPEGQLIDDVNYFLQKMIAALKIPKSYLAGDDTVGRANLAQLDVRMARSVMRIQRVMKNGYHQVARVDLSAKNIDPDMVEFKALMNIPSGVLEMAQVEVQNSKLDLADKYRIAGFSQYYIWSRVLGMSDDDINLIRQQLASEQGASQGQAESVKRLVSMDIDKGQRQAKKLDKYAGQIREEIAEGRTDFGKRMRELKLLMHEIKHSMSAKRGVRWQPER